MIWPGTEVSMARSILAGRLPDVEAVTGLGVGQHDPGRHHLRRVVDDAGVVGDRHRRAALGEGRP